MGGDINMAKTKTIRKRLKQAEERQERKPPRDLFGKYYDELTKEEKTRFWKYIYGDSYDMRQAEEIELRFISGTLHFLVEPLMSDIELPELDEGEARIRRM